MISQDNVLHIVLTVGAAAITGLFTAGGFYIYVRMSITHLEEWGKENHQQLEQKIDKNFETHDKKIDAVQKEVLGDIKGVGTKVAFIERQAFRRYINLSTALMLATPIAKEDEVSSLLKEEAS